MATYVVLSMWGYNYCKLSGGMEAFLMPFTLFGLNGLSIGLLMWFYNLKSVYNIKYANLIAVVTTSFIVLLAGTLLETYFYYEIEYINNPTCKAILN